MLAGLVLGAVGMGLQVYGQTQQTKALRSAEAARNTQMNLDVLRQRRDVARNAMMARATALASATNQGAQFGSGLQGGYGQIAGRAGNQDLSATQSQQLGQQTFNAHQKYYNASVFTDIGSGLYSLGGSMINNAGTISRIGSNWGF